VQNLTYCNYNTAAIFVKKNIDIDQGKSFWELVYGSVNQVLTDHRPAVLYDVVHFRLLCKEYLTLV